MPESLHVTSTIPTLVFLNRCYWPDTEATGQLLTDLCESLSGQFDVHVVCGQPNSPADGVEYVGSGIEQRGGVTVHRLTHSQFAKRVPAGRLLNLVSFTRAASKYLRKTPLAADCIVSETDPFLLPIVAAKYAQRCQAKLVCYLQDIYPDVAEAIGKAKDGILTRGIRHKLRAAYDQSDQVIVLGDCMRERLLSPPWSIAPSKMQVIPNWADCDAIKPIPRDESQFIRKHDLLDKFVVMHSGNMGLTQRLDVLLDAGKDPSWPSNAVIALVGAGASQSDLERKASEIPSGRVRFFPYQPREQLADSLSAADLHVVSMHEAISGCLCPSKLYGILAAGRPVLAIASPTTDLCRIVREYELGSTCDPGDSHAIARAVANFVAERQTGLDAGTKARELAVQLYDRPVVIQQFQQLFHRLCSVNPQS